MARPVVVNVGAHIGCFARRFHDRNPLARIIAVECCPENIAALRKNVGAIATVVQAAVTYEPDVALMNAVFPHCVTTGGSTIVPRNHLQEKFAAGALPAAADGVADAEYWADFRPIETVTLERLVEKYNLDRIDFLKLDCEGSEFSILQNTTMLDRIGVIVGEYHDKERFLKLVADRFGNWALRILKDGEPGVFWLTNPQAVAQAAGLSNKDRLTARKLVTADEMAALAEVYRGDGKTLVFTNGCFDLLHVGHAEYLGEAAAFGDVLIVAVNSDASVRGLKGPDRPVIGEADRAAMLAALGYVAHVLIFDEATPHELLRRLRPDVLVKGGTYTVDEVVGKEVVEAYGGRVCVTSRRPGVSTSAILAAVRRG